MREIAEREKDLKQMKDEREHKEYISNINRLAPQNIYSKTSKRGEDIRSHARTTHSPAPPNLSTYDGKTEWKPSNDNFRLRFLCISILKNACYMYIKSIQN